MNRIFLVGNLTGDIYFDHLLLKGEETPYLRLVLMADRPRPLRGMRVVLRGSKAEMYYPYLQKGSEVAVVGMLQSRLYREKTIFEIEAEHLILLRNIDWKTGEEVRQKYNWPIPTVSTNSVFVIGEVMDDLYYDWFKRSPERGEGQYAFLRLLLNNDEYLNGLRVVLRGTLAELAYPYLRPGSRIAVDGHIQTRDRETGQRVTEVTAEHIAFLENIDWEAGETARALRNRQVHPESFPDTTEVGNE